MNRIIDCPICGGNNYDVGEYKERIKGNLTRYTSGNCSDCGWYESTKTGSKASGFTSLEDLNDFRKSIDGFNGQIVPPLTYEDMVAIRTKINAPIGAFRNPDQIENDQYTSIINRRRASRDP